MEKVRPRCGQPSDRGQLKNRTEQMTKMHAKIVTKCRLVQKIEEWKLTVGRTRPIAPPASLTRCDIGLCSCLWTTGAWVRGRRLYTVTEGRVIRACR